MLDDGGIGGFWLVSGGYDSMMVVVIGWWFMLGCCDSVGL
jgi:hypothetical protein